MTPTIPRRRNVHIIVAAGSGSRYGGRLPKQFCDLDGRPMLMTTLERMHSAAPDADMVVVLSPGMRSLWAGMCAGHGFGLAHRIVDGGPTRAHSVQNALATLDEQTVGWVSVHDAARPCVTPGLFGRLAAALSAGHPGVIPAVPVTDSLRLVDADGTSVSVDRSRYRAVQTPQLFDGPTLIRSYRRPLSPQFTDEASVLQAAGIGGLALVEGDPANIKVTNPADMLMARHALGLL